MMMDFTTVDVGRLFPLAGVFDDVAVTRRGALMIGYELTLPRAYGLHEQDYDAMFSSIAAAFKVLPQWTVLHRQDMYTYESYAPPASAASMSFLGQRYYEHFRGRRHLTHRSYLYVVLGSKAVSTRPGSASGIFGLGRSVDIPTPDRVAAFRAKCQEFAAIASRGDYFKMRVLTEEDYVGAPGRTGVTQRYMMLGQEGSMVSDVALAPDGVSVLDRVAQAFSVGETDLLPSQVASVGVVDSLSIPGRTELFLSFAAPLGLLLDCEHCVNQYFIVPSQSELMRSLEKEQKKMSGGIKSADNRINAEQLRAFLDEAYNSGLFMVKSHLNVLAWGAREDAMRIKGLVSSALSSMGVRSNYNNYNTPVLYYAGIPGAAADLGHENYMTMEMHSALCLGIFETFDRGIEGGTFPICDRMRGTPLTLDIQRRAQAAGYIGNFNSFILGPSGSGKSFFMNSYVRAAYDAGGMVFIIDVGGSYKGQCELLAEETGGRDGQYMEWDKAHPLSFNLFTDASAWLDDAGNLQQDDPAPNFALSFLKTVWSPQGGWSPDTETILKQTVRDFVARLRGGVAVLNDYYRYLLEEVFPAMEKGDYRVGTLTVTPSDFDLKAFLLSLRAYSAEGEFSFLMNNPDPVDLFSSRFIVFDVDELSHVEDRKFYSLCILAIVNAFETKMRRSPLFKTMVIEEAWSAIANETMAPYLRALWKTARKFQTAAVVVTQEVADILGNEILKTAILANSDTKILLDQAKYANDFDSIQSILSLTNMDKAQVLSINRSLRPGPFYKEVFISLNGRYTGVFATEVSPAEALAYESDKIKKAPMMKLAEETGSIREAIIQMTKDKA